MILAVLVLPVLLFAYVLSRIYKVRRENETRRNAVLDGLGVSDKSGKKIVGFFHPYWCAVRVNAL